MNVIDAIKSRQSIRKYKNKPVSDKLIKEVLNAARLAPSGHNNQPWLFYVIKEKRVKDILKKHNIFRQPFIYTAPVIILSIFNPWMQYGTKKVSLYKRIKRFFVGFKLGYTDNSTALAYLTLRAQELGLSSCYVGLFGKQRIKKRLGINKKYLVVCAITLGYADEQPPKTPRKELNEILLNPSILKEK